jgi:ATP-dependent RNA helicase DDX1
LFPHPDKNELSCVCLHADRRPEERRENLDKFKSKEVQFLICTDVAARGLDINGLPFSKFCAWHFVLFL